MRGGVDNKEVLTTFTGNVPGLGRGPPHPGGQRRLHGDVRSHLRRRAASGEPHRCLLQRAPAADLLARAGELRHQQGHHRSMTARDGTTRGRPGGSGTTAGPRLLLGLAAVAVAFAAADTYVVVLALPDMMASVGIPIDELQRGAPIVSGFLLGYVAMLPLIGRIADLKGRVPVLVAALVAVRHRLAGHLASPTTSRRWWRAASCRAWEAAGWCRRRSRWSPTSTRRAARRTPRDRVRRPGARQRHRPAVRRGDPRRVRLAGDLRGQPRGRDRARAAGAPVRAAALGAEPAHPRRGLRTARLGRPGLPRGHPRHRGAGLRRADPAGQRRHLGPAVHPGPARADGRPRSAWSRSWPCCCCSSAAGRPAGRWSTCAAGGRPSARPTSRARSSWPSPWPGSSSPSRRPTRGSRCSPRRGGGTSSARSSRPSYSCGTCAPRRRRWSPAARCAVRRPGGRCWSASSSARR